MKKPTIHMLKKLILCFGNFKHNTTFYFTEKDIINNNSVHKIIEIMPDLMKFYYPVKIETPKDCITILDEFLQPLNYSLSRVDKYICGDKYYFYQVSKKYNPRKIQPILIKAEKKNIVYNFQ